jgi:hypothetical protein
MDHNTKRMKINNSNTENRMRYVPCFIIPFTLFITKTTAENTTSVVFDSLNIHDIIDALVYVLGVDLSSAEGRIKELKEKLEKVNSYAIDKEKYALLLTNVTMETNLNETNFHKALNQDDKFEFLSKKETKNLYLQLKERMNRDDIMNILAEKGEGSVIGKSARKSLWQDNFAGGDEDNALDRVVDEMLGATATDKHKYDAKDNQSIYWGMFLSSQSSGHVFFESSD